MNTILEAGRHSRGRIHRARQLAGTCRWMNVTSSKGHQGFKSGKIVMILMKKASLLICGKCVEKSVGGIEGCLWRICSFVHSQIPTACSPCAWHCSILEHIVIWGGGGGGDKSESDDHTHKCKMHLWSMQREEVHGVMKTKNQEMFPEKVMIQRRSEGWTEI